MAFEIPKERIENLSVKDCALGGWEIFKNNFVGVFIANLLFIVGAVVTIGILAGALYAGLIDYILRVKNGDANAKPTDVFSKLNILVPALLVVIVVVALTAANTMIIGGIFGNFVATLTGLVVFSVTLAMTVLGIPLLAEGKVEGANEAVQIGWNSFLLSPKTFFLLALIQYALAIVGMLLLGIGWLVTAPLGACIMALTYERLTKAREESVVV